MVGIRAAIEGNSYGGMLDLWLSHVKNVYEKYEDVLNDITDMDQKCARLCELNVVEQVMNVWKNPYVQKSWKKGHPVWVHGWIFRVETGYLEEIVVETHMPTFLRVFQFKFDDQTPHAKSTVHHVTTSSGRNTIRKSVVEPSFNSPPRNDSPISVKKDPSQKLEKKSSIWVFDDFLAA